VEELRKVASIAHSLTVLAEERKRKVQITDSCNTVTMNYNIY